MALLCKGMETLIQRGGSGFSVLASYVAITWLKPARDTPYLSFAFLSDSSRSESAGMACRARITRDGKRVGHCAVDAAIGSINAAELHAGVNSSPVDRGGCRAA
jgi:hypothetical protein